MPGLCRQFGFLILFLSATATTPFLNLRQAADPAHLLVGAAVRPSLFPKLPIPQLFPANSIWSNRKMP